MVTRSESSSPVARLTSTLSAISILPPRVGKGQHRARGATASITGLAAGAGRARRSGDGGRRLGRQYGVEQAREAGVEVLAAQREEAVGAVDARHGDAGLAQDLEVV